MPQFNLFKSSEEPVAKTPACPNCGRAMRLYDISRTGPPGCKRLIFSCSECAQQRTALVEHEEVELSGLNGAPMALSGHRLGRCTCLLLTQSGHCALRQ